MVVFSDGFETNDYTAWTGVTGTPATSSTRKHTGSYSSFINAEEQSYYDFTAADSMYARCYVNFNALPASNYLTTGVIGFEYAGSHGNTYVACVYNDPADSVNKWGIYNLFAGNITVGGTTPNLDQWYCVELFFTRGGTGKLYIDGVETITKACTNIQTDSLACGTVVSGTGSCYIDCVVIDVSYIGLETSTPTLKRSRVPILMSLLNNGVI